MGKAYSALWCQTVDKGAVRMNADQLRCEARVALCEMPPDFEKAKHAIRAYRALGHEEGFHLLLLELASNYPLNSRTCESCDSDIECVKACPRYTLKYLPGIVQFFLQEGWNHRKYGIGLLNVLLYTTDGKVILETAKLICEKGIDATQEDFDRLLGNIAEAEHHARCSWVECEADADELAAYYEAVLRVSQGKPF